MKDEKDQARIVRDIHTPVFVLPDPTGMFFQEVTNSSGCFDPCRIAVGQIGGFRQQNMGLGADLKVK